MTVNAGPTKILVVDDSALYRQSIQNVLRDVEGVSVVGWAKNGVEALQKVEELQPDLMTLDVQMPDMDGIGVLKEIKSRRLRAKAIMVSSLTASGAQVTTNALLEGAFDFILKPSSNDSAANRGQLRDALEEKIQAFRESCSTRKKRTNASIEASDIDVGESIPTPATDCQAVILAASTGGPEALKTVLPKLPSSFPVPILVVQHMPAQYTSSLATRLNDICELEVVEAKDEMDAKAGMVIIAAGGKQLKLRQRGSLLRVKVNDDPREHGVKPSVDYLIRSVTAELGRSVLAVIMTGMGRDGFDGCRHLKELGGFVFAQSQDGCIVYGMPKAVIDGGLADRILPLGKIAPAIVRHVKRSRRS